MCGCKGGLHLLYVIGLCGGFKPSVSFQDCLGIPGAKRESGKYATYGGTGTRRKKQRSTEKRAFTIQTGQHAGCTNHCATTPYSSVFLTLDFFIIYLVLHTLPCTLCPSQQYIKCCAWVLSHLCVRVSTGYYGHIAVNCIAFNHRIAGEITAHGIHHGTTHHTE